MGQFTPRLDSTGMWQSKYWYEDNPYQQSGYGLPNCTAYAYGRVYELTNSKPTYLSLGNGGDWFVYNASEGKCEYGEEPRLGAIACWAEPGEAGHVAVVEQINSDGSFVISQSGHQRPLSEYPPNMSRYFWTNTCDGTSKKASWMDSYTFQGFIYPPGSEVPEPPIIKRKRKTNSRNKWYYFATRLR